MADNRRNPSPSVLTMPLDVASRAILSTAAKLRGLGLSDYVRTIAVAQAKRDVEAARPQDIALSADEQLVFWKALKEPVRLTPAQRKLGELMRGEK